MKFFINKQNEYLLKCLKKLDFDPNQKVKAFKIVQ